MKKRKVLLVLLICLISLSVFLNIYFSFFYQYKGKVLIDEWNKNDEFNNEYIINVEKDKDKDFIILNLTDIQLSDIEDIFHRNIIRKEIDYLINEAKPDLITLTGDQTWSNENLISIKAIIRWLESYNIPYAPVFGNHDYGNDFNSAVATREYISDLFEKADNCLYRRGPSNLGSLGNYAINIIEDGKIYKTLYMLDNGYNDMITNEQIEWVKWMAEGIKENNNGNYVNGMCFMHKPIPMFANAYYEYINNNAEAMYEVLVNSSLSGVMDNGFYENAKSVGINTFVCGHQHTNSFSIKYDESIFTFALKTGELSYYYDDGVINYNGGTVFSLGKSMNIHNIYVDRDEFHINDSRNTFKD